MNKNDTSHTAVALIKESSKSIRQNIWGKVALRDDHGGALRPGLLKSKSWKLTLLFFINFFADYPYRSVRNKCGQLISGVQRDNSQCSMFKLPPCWAAHEPVDMVVWCWMENKNPPQQTERAGTERLEQRKRGQKGKNHRQMDSAVIKDGGSLDCRLRRTVLDP